MIKVEEFSSSKQIQIELINSTKELIAQEPHSHAFWELGYFDRGGGTHVIDFVEYPIKNQMIYFLNKGIVHKMQRKKESCGKVIMFDDKIVSSTLLTKKLFYKQAFISVSEDQFMAFKQLVNLLEQELLFQQQQVTPLVAKYIELLLEFYAQYATSLVELESKLQQFLIYLEQNYSAKMTVEDCCEQLNLSYNQLYKETKNRLQKSPTEIIKGRIILQAKRILFNTSDSIKEISCTLGFEEASYFSTYFKVETGLSPTEFREQQHQHIR